MHNLEGHEAPVYSLCSHRKEDIHVKTTLDSTILTIWSISLLSCLLVII